MKSKDKIVNKEERVLILVSDIDNDLYRKTGISGPLTGKVQVLNGATQLALADPEDTDSNAMFEAVKLYDELKGEGYTVNVAAITGSEREGYDADREIVRQLELVLEQYKADSCVFVTDGESDKRILPLVEARVKVNSIKLVIVKQAEGLENTYFTILEKLKEPHYARIIFGIPAILLLLFSLSYIAGLGWELPIALIGIYLLLKGFGLEDALIESFRGFGFSIDRMSFIFYMASIIFIITSIFIGIGNYQEQLSINNNPGLALSYGVEGFLILIPIVLILYLIGRIIDTKTSRHIFRSYKYMIYMGSSLIFWVFLYSFMSWFIGQIYFSQLIDYSILAIFIGICISLMAGFLKKRTIKSKKLKDKLVVNELGALIGKISKVDQKHNRLIINTSFGNPVNYSIDRVVDITDKVVIR
ncbi:MAG: DUF373 family protein [Candidatus Micrarchaeia archaeon]